jgi:hypothetical protein
MAKALADGLAYIGEDGNVVAAKGAEDELAELGLTTDEVAEFGKAIADGAEELRDYGESLRQREAEEKAYYSQMASSAMAVVDMSKFNEKE